MSTLQERVLEIVEIAKQCPENLQPICFELLLRDHLGKVPPKPSGNGEIPPPSSEGAPDNAGAAGALPEEPEPAPGDIGKGQDDLADSDLHVKVRHFLQRNKRTLGEINNLFYKEHGRVLPLYDDLKTTRLAESQVRITLLQALHQAIQTGRFECEVEGIRNECNDRKCYDSSNWSNNFTNNAGLFDFDKFNKSITTIRLSEKGKAELAELIAELQ